MSDSVKEPPLGGRTSLGGGLSDWRLPGNVTLGEVAIADPKLAYAIIGPQKREGVGVGGHALPAMQFPDCPWQWEIINICGSFTSGAAALPIKGQMQGVINRDLWVRRIVYTVRRPNAFAGNIFKAQSDHFNKLNPNVDFTLLIKSYWNYVISPDPTPLENIEMIFECVCPVGFVLRCAALIEATFTLRRALAADEIPYEICISLHTVSLPFRYDCSFEEAVAALLARGVECCL